MKKVTIIDYSMGNIGSIYNMLNYIGVDVKVSSKEKDIERADKLILPGVGSFDAGINNLQPFVSLLNDQVLNRKKHILGICLGMQLFTKNSEEGKLPGLGWFNAETVRFSNFNNRKVPHMGWNEIINNDGNHVFTGVHGINRFYFAHSYYVKANENIIATTVYEETFVSAMQCENITGVQFHPEKSHKFGMSFFKNWISF